jgi:hypothetical protein
LIRHLYQIIPKFVPNEGQVGVDSRHCYIASELGCERVTVMLQIAMEQAAKEAEEAAEREREAAKELEKQKAAAATKGKKGGDKKGKKSRSPSPKKKGKDTPPQPTPPPREYYSNGYCIRRRSTAEENEY